MEFKVKQCKICNDSLIASSDNFHKAIGNADNLQTMCKACQKARDKVIRSTPEYKAKKLCNWDSWKKRNPEKVVKQDKARHDRYKATLPDHYIKTLLVKEMKYQYGIRVLREEIPEDLVVDKRNNILFKRSYKHSKKNSNELEGRRIVHCIICNRIIGLAKDHDVKKCNKC